MDLRKMSSEFRLEKRRKDGIFKIKEKLLNCMKTGSILLLNLDDTDFVYEDLFDPELSCMFGGRVPYQNLWSPEIMLEKKNWKSFAGEKEPIPETQYSV